MTTLIDALRTKDALTTNGMVTNSTSLNNCVDLFFQVGAMRGGNKQTLINVFTKAYGENPLVAMRLLFWARDVRGGAGERQIFRDIITYLAKNRGESLKQNISVITEYGRWDDLLCLFGTPLEADALALISEALVAKNSLTAKWMPRPNVASKDKKAIANTIRKFMGLSPKEYRKLLTENSNTVEQLMCAKEFDKIDYSKLPSKAMSDLMKSFSRNDLERFQKYLASLEKGETTINAGAIYPYDVLKNLKQGNVAGANLQWNALPNYLEGNNEIVLPIVDVSGSMGCSAGGSPSITCMDVAISLGLYISERNEGLFEDAFITFSSSPTLEVVNGSLSERYNQMKRANWSMSTNIEATFKMLLNKAVASNVSADQMPTMMLILSDMQFDRAGGQNWGSTAQEMIENEYASAGYKTPKIVYWNLNASNGGSPVAFDKQGTALVSGFSPSILKNLLAGNDMTPLSMMMTVVDSERYACISI
jgi:hypothetical protein